MFFGRFVDEMNHLLENGLLIESKPKICVKLRLIMGDSPARCYMKSELPIHSYLLSTLPQLFPIFGFLDVVNFNGFNGCLKCIDRGKYTEKCGVVFPKFDAPRRTDASFRSGIYADYHHGPTPLTDLPIDMILDFPIGDQLHLIDLGVTKRFLKHLIDGKLNMRLKWSSRMKQEISKYLKSVKRPSEIHRQIRGIDELVHWKGTEFRVFLLYTSIVVFRKVLPQKYYQHFLLYFSSITIFSTQYHMTDLMDMAEEMLTNYLNVFKSFFGYEQCVSNVHNLSHLADEVRRFGPLMTFSTYPFETKLAHIKRLLRSGNLPLSQVGKRLIEQEIVLAKEISIQQQKPCTLKKRILNHSHPNFEEIYAEIQFSEYMISNTDGNNFFLTTDLEVAQCEFIVIDKDEKKFVYGRPFKVLNDFFDIPFESRGLHIYLASTKDLLPPKLYSVDNIKAKMFVLKYFGDFNDDDEDEDSCIDDKFVFIPLNHTLK